jgi:hypothetical protein
MAGFVEKAAASRWSRPLHRRELRDRAHPGGEPRAVGSEIAEAALCGDVESHCENQVRHSRRTLHQRIGYAILEHVGHALRTR